MTDHVDSSIPDSPNQGPRFAGCEDNSQMLYCRLVPRSTGQGKGTEISDEACMATLYLMEYPELMQDAVIDLRWQTFEDSH